MLERGCYVSMGREGFIEETTFKMTVVFEGCGVF